MTSEEGRILESDDGQEPPSGEALLLEEEGSEVLLEADGQFRFNGSKIETILIREGLSYNNKFYPREALESSIPLWEGQDICDYGWMPTGPPANHITPQVERAFPRGTYRNKVGHLANVHGRVGSDGKYELIAEGRIVCPTFRQKLVNEHETGGKLPALSIHAYGPHVHTIREGRPVVLIPRFNRTRELTVVSKAGAQGGISRLLASGIQEEEISVNPKSQQRFRAYLATTFPAMSTILESADDTALLSTVANSIKEAEGDALKQMATLALKFLGDKKVDEATEVLQSALDTMGAPAAPPAPADPMFDPIWESRKVAAGVAASAAATAANSAADAKLLEARQAQESANAVLAQVQTIHCSTLLESRIKESGLPEPAIKAIREDFTGQIFEAAALDKSIQRARDLIAATSGGGTVVLESTTQSHHVIGNPVIQILAEGPDRIQAASDLLFDYPWREDKTLTESQKELYRSLDDERIYSPLTLYRAATDDWEDTNTIRSGSILESAGTLSFPNIFGLSINKVLSFVFTNDLQKQWAPLIKEINVTNLKQQTRNLAGTFTTLPGVLEKGEYKDLGVPLELPVDYTLGKIGGLFSFTEEAVYADDLGYFRSIIPALKDAGEETLDQFAWGLVTGKNNTLTSYDNLAHYHAYHGNLGDAALSYAAADAARQSLRRVKKLSFKTQLNGGITNSATTITVDSTSGFQVGNYMRIEGEIVQITGVSNDTTATISRAKLATVAASHADDAGCYVYGGVLKFKRDDLHLVVPVALETLADTINTSNQVPGGDLNDMNQLKGKFNVISVPEEYLDGSFTNWYMQVGAKSLAGLEIAYFNNKRHPEVIVQDAPAVGRVFTNDEMTYKAKFRFGGKGIQHEGRYASRPA